MKNKKKSLSEIEFEEKFWLIGIAQDWVNFEHVVRQLTEAAIEVRGGDTVHPWAIYVADVDGARERITGTHRYRTGDLNVYLLETPRRAFERMLPEDESNFVVWQASVRKREPVEMIVKSQRIRLAPHGAF